MTGPIRLAVVTPQLPPDIGGLSSYVGWVTQLLADQDDFEVVVLAPGSATRTRYERWEGVAVIRLGTWFRLSNTPVNPLWPLQLAAWFRRLRIDAVLAHSPVPLIADMAVLVSGRRPVLLTYHAGSLLKGGGLVDVLLRVYERHVLPRVFAACDTLVAVSPVSTAFATGRAVLVPPGVDSERFFPPYIGEHRDLSVLYVGRIEASSQWKGLRHLIEAMPLVLEQVPSAVLELVGDGDDVAALQRHAEVLGVADRLRWHGALPPDDVAKHYRRAGVTVLPSVSDAESFGMTLVEAMSSGCAVVGSAVGGIPFVIRDGVDGHLVPPGDSVALARAIVRVLTDPGHADALGTEGRRAAVERWDWRLQQDSTLTAVRSLVSGPQPTAG